MITIDEYPATMSLMLARSERDRPRSLLRGGANPTQVARIERAAQIERAGTTFEVIAAELLNKRAREGLSPGSVKRERRLIEKDLASIADLPVTDVNASILLSALRKLEKRGVVETAHRAHAVANQVVRYAIATGRAGRNSAADLAGALETSRPAVLSRNNPDRLGQRHCRPSNPLGEPG